MGPSSMSTSQENYTFYVILNVPDCGHTYYEKTFGKSEQIRMKLEIMDMNKNKQGIFS